MKKLSLLLIILFAGITAWSQKSNLVFFSEQGERFYIILNGIQQNEKAATNVMVSDLNAPGYKLKVIFEDKGLAEIDKKLMFNQGTETTFNIKKNHKGEYVIRYQGEVPLAQAPAPPPQQQVVVYQTSPRAAGMTMTQTTTTTTTAPATGANVGVSVNDPATGVNINVNAGAAGSSSTTTTTTMTTSTMTTASNPPVVVENPPAYVLPGYSGPIGCPMPMSPSEFQQVKNSIASKTFEDSKLTIAKQVVGANCLLCSQVKEIMKLFTYEDTRLEFAKFAYGHTFDLGNYYKLNDAFTYESSIDELNEYINGR